MGDQKIVILGDDDGTSRAYAVGEVQFTSWNGIDTAVDSTGKNWKVVEDKLVADDQELQRVPSHNVFWFGWVAQFPETRLVK